METATIVKSQRVWNRSWCSQCKQHEWSRTQRQAELGRKHFFNYHFSRPPCVIQQRPGTLPREDRDFHNFYFRFSRELSYLCWRVFFGSTFISFLHHFSKASRMHASDCLLLDTHSQHYENLFIRFSTRFHSPCELANKRLAAPNSKTLRTRETLDSNWSWKMFNRSAMVWMEREKAECENKRETSSVLTPERSRDDVEKSFSRSVTSILRFREKRGWIQLKEDENLFRLIKVISVQSHFPIKTENCSCNCFSPFHDEIDWWSFLRRSAHSTFGIAFTSLDWLIGSLFNLPSSFLVFFHFLPLFLLH